MAKLCPLPSSMVVDARRVRMPGIWTVPVPSGTLIEPTAESSLSAPPNLPTGFEGNPLRKEFPLLARVVKPWPGIVDVEPMPGGDDEDEAAEGEGQEGTDG